MVVTDSASSLFEMTYSDNPVCFLFGFLVGFPGLRRAQLHICLEIIPLKSEAEIIV